MSVINPNSIESAEVVLPCANFSETLSFFTEDLGLRLDTIFPADDPAVAVVSGHGVRIRLDKTAAGDPGTLRLASTAVSEETGPLVVEAPNGTRIELHPAPAPHGLPPLAPALVVTKAADGDAWVTGRAGMQYRDLIPGRLGGRFIASHIRIPEGGPVPDMVHYHRVRFQMIYCIDGWVRVVYQDQGGPMLMQAGDCFLQPPGIRHRVLEASPGLEVLEIGCPAEHPTFIDHDLTLPTGTLAPDRVFGGQQFVFFQAETAAWHAASAPGVQFCDLGIAAATGGLAGARTLRPIGKVGIGRIESPGCDAEFLFYFVRKGTVTFDAESRGPDPLAAGDSVAIPPSAPFAFHGFSDEAELLEVALPAESSVFR